MMKKEFRIVFVYLDFDCLNIETRDTVYSGFFNMGIGYLSSVLKREGYSTSLIHLVSNISQKEFVKRILDENPNIIAFSFTSPRKNDVIRYVNYIRKARISIPIVLGGAHCTVSPDDSINIPGIDYICVGEGEYALRDLCNRIYKNSKTSDIPNIWKKSGNRIIKNPVRSLVKNIDEFPSPDRELFDYNNLIDTKRKYLPVLTTRGCPYDCAYCVNHSFHELYDGKGQRVRTRSPKMIIKEIKDELQKHPKIEYIIFRSELFFVDKKFLKTLCILLKKEVNLKFHAFIRFEFLDEETIVTLSNSGCTRLFVGIESGNSDIRNRVLGRGMTNNQIENVIALCERYGINLTTLNMVGLPDETLENVLETIKLNSYKNVRMQLHIFQPYPNTKLYNYCIRKNMITKNRTNGFFDEYLLRQKSISKDEVYFSYKYANIYLKLYKTIGRIAFVRHVLDKSFLSRKTHKVQLFFYPLMYFITQPVHTAFVLMLKIFPKFALNFIKNN